MNQILVYRMFDKSLELLWRQQLSIIQQFGASAFYTVMHRHKQGEVDNECTLHYRLGYLCAKNYQIWWRFDEVLTKTSWVIFLAHSV